MTRNLLIALVAVLALGGGFALRQITAPPAATPAATADPLTAAFPDLQGQRRTLSEWRGKVLVVNFWATWCPPCLKEIPAFVDLQRQHGPAGLQFVGVALDAREEVASFVAKREINYPILFGEEDVARYMQEQGNKIGALPFTLVFDRSGALRHTQQGEWAAADAARVLTGILAE